LTADKQNYEKLQKMAFTGSYNDLHSHKKSASAKRLCVDL